MRDLRPVRRGWFLVWGAPGGRGVWPVPRPFAAWLVTVWNHVACRLVGHDDTLWHLYQADPTWFADGSDPRCGNCCRPLHGCTGSGLHHDWGHL